MDDPDYDFPSSPKRPAIQGSNGRPPATEPAPAADCSQVPYLQWQQLTAKPHQDALLQRVELRLRGLQVGGFKALAEAIVHRLQ
jgi:hypothetical protein